MKLLRRSKVAQATLEEAASLQHVAATSFSLGAGAFTLDAGVENFVPSPRKQRPQQQQPVDEVIQEEEREEPVVEKPKPIEFQRGNSSFLRVSDLKLHDAAFSSSNKSTAGDTVLMGDSFSEDGNNNLSASSHSMNSDIQHANFHHVSTEPPPGLEADPAEQWIALDNGAGVHAPVAPLAVQALVESAVNRTNQADLWKPDGKTSRLLNAGGWYNQTWGEENETAWPQAGSTDAETILVWSGTFAHGGYGSDLPVVRAAGIIPMSARALLDMLVDSNRVHEYNKLSLGRTDMLVLQDSLQESDDKNADAGPFGGITKVMRSESRPPLVRKTLQFTSLLHARKAPTGGSYHLVTRAVEGGPTQAGGDGDAMKSEILLGVNILQPVDENRCLLVAVNHVRSPMVPMMIAKRIGLQAAVNFFYDVRKAAV